jgi:hypothetical protein
MLLLHIDESGWPRLTPAEQEAGLAAYADFAGALAKAGAFLDTGRLAPSAGAFTVRTKGGRPVVMDGPYAEAKEQIAGYFLIEAPDDAAARDWAERCPAAGHGAVEVRALQS